MPTRDSGNERTGTSHAWSLSGTNLFPGLKIKPVWSDYMIFFLGSH